MTDNHRRPFGIVFVGPPGQFSVWHTTPRGELMDREVVEYLGQLASLAGAADYRVFELDRDQSLGRTESPFATCETMAQLEPMLRIAGGVPASVPDS